MTEEVLKYYFQRIRKNFNDVDIKNITKAVNVCYNFYIDGIGGYYYACLVLENPEIFTEKLTTDEIIQRAKQLNLLRRLL